MLPRAKQELASPIEEIERRLKKHDGDTVLAVKKAGGYLGVLLQNVASAYDPGCIVLGGRLVDLGEVFLASAMKTLDDYSSAANLEPPAVRISRFGADAVAIGAAALARYRLTRPLNSHRSVAQDVE